MPDLHAKAILNPVRGVQSCCICLVNKVNSIVLMLVKNDDKNIGS